MAKCPNDSGYSERTCFFFRVLFPFLVSVSVSERSCIIRTRLFNSFYNCVNAACKWSRHNRNCKQIQPAVKRVVNFTLSQHVLHSVTVIIVQSQVWHSNCLQLRLHSCKTASDSTMRPKVGHKIFWRWLFKNSNILKASYMSRRFKDTLKASYVPVLSHCVVQSLKKQRPK